MKPDKLLSMFLLAFLAETQSHTQSPLGFWSAGGCQGRLWGSEWKNAKSMREI